MSAPSPILHYYDWVGQFTPYKHQKLTSAFLTIHKKCLVLNEIGTGKTQSALWAADYLMDVGKVKKVLIVSPLSTLEHVWGNAIFTGFFHRKHVVLHGPAARRLKLLRTDVDFYITNHDGFRIIAEESVGKFDLVIVDEAAVLRTPSTVRYRIFVRWMRKNPHTRLWLMTGTPTPDSPTNAWTLAQLVENPFVTSSYTAFREQTMVRISQHKWVPKPNSAETVKNVLQPAVRYARDDCLDLPDTVIQTRQVDLTKEQKKYFDEMMRRLIVDVKSKDLTVSAINEAVKLQKLVQIACGVVYTDDGSEVEVDCSPRINDVQAVIREAGSKIIIFVPLTGVLNMLERELAKQWSVGVVNGSVSSANRLQIFNNFQNSKDPHILLAHPATMAHGLTLTEASTIIWYGPITSNEQYVQANGRVERIGKKHASNVVHIESTELEHEMYRRLANKQKLQGLLLEIIQQWSE